MAPELQYAPAMNVLTAIEDTGIASWVRESPSVLAYPMIIFAHSAGLSLIVGLNSVLDLSILGFARGIQLAPLRKLFPIMAVGFWINLGSGALLTMADASTMLVSPVFWTKMSFIFLALEDLFLIRIRVFNNPELDKTPPSTESKVLAIASLLFWTGAIVAGRLTAYLGPSAATGF